MRILLLITLCFCGSVSVGQFGLPPIVLEIEPIANTNTPGLHSFAFAQSGDKWMFVGGRINGMHGLNVNGGFPLEEANDNVIVVDTSTWMTYSASLSTLPFQMGDPLRSTNMQYWHSGDHLYMIGGYGFDSINMYNATFPILSAIHVDSMIDAVMNAAPIQPHIRQLTDTALMVCGGELEKLGDYYYLLFGHDFAGRYDDDSPSFLFTQTYTDGYGRFQIDDDGVNLSVANYTFVGDTAQFHRRDLNADPIIMPGGVEGFAAYAGVFRRDYNLPFLSPIIFDGQGSATVRLDFEQQFNQYTTAIVPIYDSVAQKMHTVFLGGTSVNYFNDTTQQVRYDSLVPFINDITIVSLWPDNSIHEHLMPVELPSLIGTNAKFIFNKNVPHYSNEVIKIRELTGRTMVGYMYGGIRAEEANGGNSYAHDTIYRIYITPDFSLGAPESESLVEYLTVYPNPATNALTLHYQVAVSTPVQITIFDLEGRAVFSTENATPRQGISRQHIDISSFSAGIYVCRLVVAGESKTVKFSVVR